MTINRFVLNDCSDSEDNEIEVEDRRKIEYPKKLKFPKNWTIDRVTKIAQPFFYQSFKLKRVKLANTSTNVRTLILYHDTTRFLGKALLDKKVESMKLKVANCERVEFANSIKAAVKYSNGNKGANKRILFVTEVITDKVEIKKPFTEEWNSVTSGTIKSEDGKIYAKFNNEEFFPKYIIYYTERQNLPDPSIPAGVIDPKMPANTNKKRNPRVNTKLSSAEIPPDGVLMDSPQVKIEIKNGVYHYKFSLVKDKTMTFNPKSQKMIDVMEKFFEDNKEIINSVDKPLKVKEHLEAMKEQTDENKYRPEEKMGKELYPKKMVGGELPMHYRIQAATKNVLRLQNFSDTSDIVDDICMLKRATIEMAEHLRSFQKKYKRNVQNLCDRLEFLKICDEQRNKFEENKDE